MAPTRRCAIAAIGPVTAEALSRFRLAPDVVSESPGARELVAALAEHVATARDSG